MPSAIFDPIAARHDQLPIGYKAAAAQKIAPITRLMRIAHLLGSIEHWTP
jgi:hypothetical protein